MESLTCKWERLSRDPEKFAGDRWERTRKTGPDEVPQRDLFTFPFYLRTKTVNQSEESLLRFPHCACSSQAVLIQSEHIPLKASGCPKHPVTSFGKYIRHSHKHQNQEANERGKNQKLKPFLIHHDCILDLGFQTSGSGRHNLQAVDGVGTYHGTESSTSYYLGWLKTAPSALRIFQSTLSMRVALPEVPGKFQKPAGLRKKSVAWPCLSVRRTGSYAGNPYVSLERRARQGAGQMRR